MFFQFLLSMSLKKAGLARLLKVFNALTQQKCRAIAQEISAQV
ncbi:MAG TPA: hypothetical protein DEB17_03920 [Chlorobaculum sp.]|uniref:Uncharacterized protein n=1 Tax=Chlorobaculum tepidum (strain ATCC 49652 / DSM 12025 / NBRC 103806 / TLS) TaxID=194439 RepID=Q8KDZ0_CHLTE|nr:hypothetical protein CT0904 [Chlorobaculum tepidum TLS]HBU23133.1 hypothetical protein [Chlorobaculum sp.]